MEDGKRAMTPMLLVMTAVGGTDILFALDSIPAIFGLTQNTFSVFTATAFSLLGLRQLFFLIDGLLDRLIHLSYGLAVILGFIGVKLVLHALHQNSVPFINNGDPVPVVEISTELSLIIIIIGVPVVSIVASRLSPAGRPRMPSRTHVDTRGLTWTRSTPTTRPSASASSSCCCPSVTRSSRWAPSTGSGSVTSPR